MRTPPGLSVASRASVDHQPAVRRLLRPVAVAPDAGEDLEVGGAVLGARGVVPERHRHRRERRGAHQLPGFSHHALALGVPHLHRHAEPAALQLAPIHGKQRVAQREAGDDVGAARDARNHHPRLHVARHVVERVRRKGTPGAQDGPHRREVVRAHRRQPRLLGQRQELGAGAEHGHALLGGEVPEYRLVARGTGRAVVEHDRGARGERRDQPVPHHPAAGGEVEDPVVALQVGVQPVLLEVLQQRAAGAVHHALGQAGGSRRVHDVQRVVERQPLEHQRDAPRPAPAKSTHATARGTGAQVGRLAAAARRPRAPPTGWHRRCCARVRGSRSPCPRTDSRRRRRAPAARSGRTGRARPPDAEVGRARRPDRADGRRREHRDDRLGDVRQEAGHAVAGHDARGAQRRGHGRHLVVQLAPGQAARPAAFVAGDDRHPIVAPAQQVLGEVEARRFKPDRAEQRVRRRDARATDQHGVPRAAARQLVGNHPTPAPECTPHRLAIAHGPGVPFRPRRLRLG